MISALIPNEWLNNDVVALFILFMIIAVFFIWLRFLYYVPKYLKDIYDEMDRHNTMMEMQQHRDMVNRANSWGSGQNQQNNQEMQ